MRRRRSMGVTNNCMKQLFECQTADAVLGGYAAVGAEERPDAVGRARQDRGIAALDDRPLNQIGVCDHQVQEFGIAQVAVADPERLVNRILRAEKLPRSHAQLAQQLLQLPLRNRVGVVVHRLEVDAALLQRAMNLTACGARRLLIDDDSHDLSQKTGAGQLDPPLPTTDYRLPTTLLCGSANAWSPFGSWTTTYCLPSCW